MTQNIAILGASGYTGAELVRLIATHPSMTISALSADRQGIKNLGQQIANGVIRMIVQDANQADRIGSIGKRRLAKTVRDDLRSGA